MNVFALSVNRGAGPGSYSVQVDTTAAGESSADFTMDVEAMLARREPIQAALLASAAATRGSVTPLERPVRELGTALFEALFSSPRVSGRYQASLAMARDRGESLRVLLRINAPELAALPWEAMYDTEAGGYVSRSEPLVRRVPVAAALTPLAVTAPMRILGIVSAPRGLAALDVEAEQQRLAAALRAPIAAGVVELTWAPAATWETVHELLLSERWHVVHFIGHGDFDTDKAEGILALVGDRGRAHRVSADRFADLLREARPMPRLVVLNSCASATSGADDLFSGTAAALVRSGVRAVAAMQFSITDRAAIAFSHAFYAALAHGRGVDDAVHSGRVGILGTGGQTLEWLTPVLYLRGDDAQLFTVTRRPGTTANPPVGTAEPAHPAPEKPASVTARHARPPRPDDHQEAAVSRDRAPQPLVPGRHLRTITTTPQVSRWTKNLGTSVCTVVFSPDGRLLASASAHNTVRLWNPDTGQLAGAPLGGHTSWVIAVAFSPDGRLLASAGEDNTVRLWSLDIGELAHAPLSGHTNWVTAVAFSPNGRLLASASVDKTVRLWSPDTGQPVGAPLTGHTNRVRAVAFSPDGRLLATASDDKTVRLWSPDTGQPVGAPLTGHTNRVRAVAFSPDGRLLATAGNDETVRLCDSDTGQLVGAPLIGHTNWVSAVAFSPNGRLLASAGADKTVRLWNPDTGQPVGAPLTGHATWVVSVAFSPDGRLLASASDDRTIRIWGGDEQP
ncbi:CHAT domain-containing protein [Actinoplanes sp. NPDC000266]